MGVAIQLSEHKVIGGSIVLVIFMIVVPVGVIGIPQVREAREERRRRGSFTLTREGDLAKFYLPTWGRLFVWFASCSASVLLMKSLGS
jgi:hypothetical protein